MQGPCLCFPPTDPKERFFSKLAVGRLGYPGQTLARSFSFKPDRAGERTPVPGRAGGKGPRQERTKGRGDAYGGESAELTSGRALQSGPWSLGWKRLFRLEGSPGDSLSSKTIASSKPQGPLPLSLQVLLLGGQVGSFGFFSVFLIIEKSRPIQAKENRETPGFPSNKEAACFVVFSCFFPPQKLTHHPRNNLPREDLIIFPPIWKKVKVSVTRSWLTLWPHGL